MGEMQFGGTRSAKVLAGLGWMLQTASKADEWLLVDLMLNLHVRFTSVGFNQETCDISARYLQDYKYMR